MRSSTNQKNATKDSESWHQPLAVHHIELWVGNALQASHYFRSALGFTLVGLAGPGTNCQDRVSYLMSLGTLHVILSSGLSPESPITKWVSVHGDGVRDIAFLVRSAEKTWRSAVQSGAKSIEDPHEEQYEQSRCDRAAITAFGDTVHSLISADTGATGWFGNFRRFDPPSLVNPIVAGLDHVAVAVESGHMEELGSFYSDVFALSVTHREDISTNYSGMRSQVLQNNDGSVRLTIVEPVTGKRISQVQEFVKSHTCAGVQHIALLTSDIFATSRAMKSSGVELLSPPLQYYDLVSQRLPESPFDTHALRQSGVMLDKDEWGYLLQVFSRPVHCRPTLFVELIQRNGARGFGRGNIRALFEAIESEMMARGTS